jgi:hypothetical protein
MVVVGSKSLIEHANVAPGVAAARQSAANWLFSGNECGALPSRRY